MKFILIGFCLFSLTAKAQMSARSFVPFSKGSSGGAAAPAYAGTNDFDATKLPTFGLYGIGNTNTETFNNINSSGKLSGYIRPFKGTLGAWKVPAFIDVNFGFNVNAANTDSLLVNTVLFPDAGKNSFSGSIVFNIALGKNPDYYLISPFFEFATKTVSGRKTDSARTFYTINSTYGVNFQYLYVDADDKVSFTISPYLASVNIPDPGTKDYKYLFTSNESSPLKTTINSWGVKCTFQYNYFQIFADLRTVKGTEAELPVPGYRGFHPNIGIIFNAEIFEK
ncbi:hypothetical protein BDD43_2260 [Mucilaginibacter gracilis]|uniref:Outer membrane protein with beta-barrel domain n=1 Tax=Mucilaginibacter gracilis TaxID=423350 RepID=A0A495IZZ5_9SPHI|nr:hypothetical protein [Mucilaginibacter gracilis]RKR82093.1 hypothetical protein BDD43_2260 [Mucilaginibacter gracilis]